MRKWTSDILTLQKFDVRLRDLEVKYRTIPQEKSRMKEELEAAAGVVRKAKEHLQIQVCWPQKFMPMVHNMKTYTQPAVYLQHKHQVTSA